MKKLFFAFIELGEASHTWKNGVSEKNVAEELIDAMFYALDAGWLACPPVNADEMFWKKLERNREDRTSAAENAATYDVIQ